MQFSLKYLFALTAVVAFFTTAILNNNASWALAAVNLTAVALICATIGVFLRRLNLKFWLSFCVTGWFYFIWSLVPYKADHHLCYVPSKYIAYFFRPEDLDGLLDQFSVADLKQMPLLVYGGTSLDRLMAIHFLYLVDIIDACFAVFAGTLAGVISSVLLRDKGERWIGDSP
jgi:hypothetical protein